MRHPSCYYIRYLLARGFTSGTETYQTVSITLEALGLPSLKMHIFEEIKNQFQPPAAFFFQNRKHLPTANFMRAQKIHALWCAKNDERQTLELLRYPNAKEAVQILLMGRLPHEDIARRVSGRFKIELSPRAVANYAHYFWNVELCSFTEWSSLLHGHPQRDGYLAALYGSPSQALYRAGFSPQVKSKAALREAHRAIAMRLEATRRFPDTRETATMLGTLTRSLLDVHTALHGEGAGMEEMMKEFLKFKMTRSASNVIPIHALAKAGNYSHSGVSTEDSDDE